MLYFGTAVFGVMALGLTIAAYTWPLFGSVLMLLALPVWLLFVLYLVRALKG